MAGTDPATSEPRAGVWRRLVVTLLVLVLAGLAAWMVAIAVWRDRAVPWGSLPDDSVTRFLHVGPRGPQDPVQTSREFLAAFLRVDYRDMASPMDTTLAMSTDPFRAEYQSARDQIVARALTNKSQVEAEIGPVGVVAADADHAELLVAAQSTLTDRSTTTPRKTELRLRVRLARSAGKWLVSEVTFLP